MNCFVRIQKYLPLIGILLFILVLWKIGVANIFDSLVKARFLLLIPFVLFFIPVTLLQVFKWYYIVRLQKIEISFLNAFKFHVVSSFLGLITPGRIGLLSKIFFLKKNAKKSTGECASSIILDKAFDFSLLVLFGFIGSLFLLNRYDLNLIIGVFLFLFIIGVFFLFNKKVARFFLKWIYRYLIPQKFKDKIRLNFHTFYDCIPPFKKMILPIILSILTWGLLYTQSYVLSRAFNINVPYLSFIFIISIVTLITLLPITLFGIGTREISLITLFYNFNVNTGNLISFSIVSAFSAPLFFFIGYMLYAKKVSLNLDDEQEKFSQE